MVVEEAHGAKMEEQFVQQMKLLREVQRISQGDLASRMANAGWEYWRQTTVSRVEKFERTVRLAEAVDIAKILGLPLAGMLTVSEEVQNQNIGAAERRRDLDDWVGRLNESMASFMAQLEQFRTTLNQANAPDQDDAVRAAIQQIVGTPTGPDSFRMARAAQEAPEESARLRTQDADDDRTKEEARDGINPEA